MKYMNATNHALMISHTHNLLHVLFWLTVHAQAHIGKACHVMNWSIGQYSLYMSVAFNCYNSKQIAQGTHTYVL